MYVNLVFRKALWVWLLLAAILDSMANVPSQTVQWRVYQRRGTIHCYSIGITIVGCFKTRRGHSNGVDTRRANVAFVRKHHPIPTIEEILYDLDGTTVFSKLDLKCRWRFHQVQLEEKSRKMTTFVTNRGLYRYKRLIFESRRQQKIISDVIQGGSGRAD